MDLLQAARKIIATAPRDVSRRAGVFGDAWDELLNALQAHSHDEVDESVPMRPVGGIDSESLAHAGLVVASAAEMAEAVQASGDERVIAAWQSLRLCLLGNG